MALDLEIDHRDLKTLQGKIAMFSKGYPKAVARAMTAAGIASVNAVKAATPRFVDNPTPYTLNAWGRWPGYVDKTRLNLWIGLKTTGGQVNHYLRPIIDGGQRRLKASERRLANTAIVPTGLSPLRFNRYGNISGGQYTQVLSRLGRFNIDGYNANRSQAARSQMKQRDRMYFIRPLKDGNRLAIFARGRGRKATPVFIFQPKPPTYRKQFPASKIIFDAFSKSWDTELPKFLGTAFPS